MKHAVVIIPTYNEVETIEATLKALYQVFAGIADWKLSVLVVDDSSPDGTAQVVKKQTSKHPEVSLLSNAQKAGLGAAYLAGMKHAFSVLKADVVFEFDADLSHDPTKIPDFLTKLNEGYDMVLGSRYRPGGGIPQDWALHRKFLSVVGNWIIMLVLTNFSIRDWTSGYRAITKKVYQAVAPVLTEKRFTGYTFQVGFLYNAIKLGFSVTDDVPYVFKDRTHGKSKIGPEYIKNTLSYIFQIRLTELYHNRIFRFAVVGGIGAVVQLTSLTLWRTILPPEEIYYQIAFFLAIETAVLSNFLINNVWTFSDRKLTIGQMPVKFLQMNLASAGSIVIQQVTAVIGQLGIGLFALLTIPLIGFTVDTGMMYAVVGILLGMTWNFFAYNKFIWKKTQA